MTTIIKLTLDGVPVDWNPATDPDIKAIAQAVRAAKAAGFQGQPLRSSFGGPGKPGRPPVPQPTIDAQGRLCCPYDGAPLRQKPALDNKWACDCKGPQHEHVNERGYCRYIIAPDAVTVKAEPARSDQGPPRTAEEAASRFWRRYGPIVGGTHWGAVQRYLGHLLAQPRTVEEWIAVAEEVRDRQKEAA